jgi:hypothetical protein
MTRRSRPAGAAPSIRRRQDDPDRCEQFLVEIGDGQQVTGLPELNRLFTPWAEAVYQTRPHPETGQPLIDWWLVGAPFATPSPAQLREAFLWPSGGSSPPRPPP